MPAPTLADEFLIADLPDNVKEAIARVYGLRGEFTREDLEAAYEAGFEEGTEIRWWSRFIATARQTLRAT